MRVLVGCLAAVALLVATGASAAGPAAKKQKLDPRLGSPGGVIAYGKSRLLLLGGYEEDKITRIYKDGSLDRSFGDRGHVHVWFAGVTVAPDGKVLLAGCEHARGDRDNSDGQIIRLLPNGKRDPSFGGDGSVLVDFGGRFDCAESIAVAADGEILVAGHKATVENRGSDAVPAFARLRANGSLDRSFGDHGVRIVQNTYETGVYDIAATPDGGVIGIGEDIGAALWKLTAGGSLDRSFGRRGTAEVPGWGKHRIGGGHAEAEMISQLIVLPSGKILLAGTGFPDYRALAIRLRPNGKRDRSFGRDGWAAAAISGPTFVNGMTMLPGGVLLLSADAHSSKGKRSDIGAIAFGPNGRPDPRFGRRGRISVDLAGGDMGAEENAVTTLAGRAVIIGEQGKGKGTWLVTCPPLAGR